jgi:hypothetical protein
MGKGSNRYNQPAIYQLNCKQYTSPGKPYALLTFHISSEDTSKSRLDSEGGVIGCLDPGISRSSTHPPSEIRITHTDTHHTLISNSSRI